MRNLQFYANLPLLPNAACRSHPSPEIFFPISAEEIEACLPLVRATCNACVEKEPCLEYALSHQINHGIWAGKTPGERDLIIEARLRKDAAQSKGAIQSILKEKDYSKELPSLSESQQ